jgi:hypothetical protein
MLMAASIDAVTTCSGYLKHRAGGWHSPLQVAARRRFRPAVENRRARSEFVASACCIVRLLQA